MVFQHFARTLLFEVGTALWFGTPACGAAFFVKMWSSGSNLLFFFFFTMCKRQDILKF